MTITQLSLARLKDVHPDLVLVVLKAHETSRTNFIVTEGARTKDRQEALYAQGRTTPGKIVTWTLKSKHLKQADGYSHAVDLAPVASKGGVDWSNLLGFRHIKEAMMAAAKELGFKVRWGGDWNQNEKEQEKGENDLPHFELVKA